jgi:hypothetical protein
MRIPILPSIALACSAVLLTACVTPIPDHVALDPAARASIDSTEVVAPVKQSEIYVFVPASRVGAATGGGLIGALIDVSVDAHRAKTATDSVKPLRDATVDYSFDQKLTADLQQSLSQVAWLKVDGVRVMKDVAPDNLGTAITGSKHGAVLMVDGDYQLSNDGTTLTVTLVADLYANNDGLKKFKPTKTANEKVWYPGNAIYRGKFVHTEVIPGAGHDRDANIALWSGNNGKPVRDALDKAVDDLTRQLTEDIASDSSAPWQKTSK